MAGIVKGVIMAIYVTLSTLTEVGKKTLRENPGRVKEVNKEMEKMGIKVLYQYALLGSHDFINVLDAPDNETIHRIITEQGSRGTHYSITMPALDVDAFIANMKVNPII
jgi:uncharacterized protein with GYD domain